MNNAPGINPCGAIVDVLRSCYASTWRFYPADSTIETPGYYYFVPPTQRVLAFEHPFFSSTWTVGDAEREERFGPIPDAPRTWRNGALGFDPPPGFPVGDPVALRDGLRIPQDVYAGESRGGIPITCWTNFRWPFVPWSRVSALHDCCLQRAYARIVQLCYGNDFATAVEFIQTWVGPAATILQVPEAGLIPAGLVVCTNAFSLVFVSGTSNFQQLALQAASGATAPVSQGLFSTQPLWASTANHYADKLIEGQAPADKPLLLVGHSYGAAVCCVLATRVRRHDPSRPVSLMTFGCPKPGDQRMIDILRGVVFRHIANTGDFVTWLPPDARLSAGLAPPVLIAGALTWFRWKGFPQYQMLHADGRITYEGLERDTQPGWDDLVDALVDLIEVPPIVPHFIEEYIRRLGLHCVCPNAFIDRTSWDILFNRAVAAQAGLLVGQDEDRKWFVQEENVVTISDGDFTADKEPRGGVQLGGGGRVQVLKFSHGVKVGEPDES